MEKSTQKTESVFRACAGIRSASPETDTPYSITFNHVGNLCFTNVSICAMMSPVARHRPGITDRPKRLLTAYGALAQLVECHTGSVDVRSSSLLCSTKGSAGRNACRPFSLPRAAAPAKTQISRCDHRTAADGMLIAAGTSTRFLRISVKLRTVDAAEFAPLILRRGRYMNLPYKG